ncbi:hypothetical protein [Nostoc sp. LPT]|uniref:hypothetical protein n=1 Tax=Nostoc sp. LPT TaxID=2815387 RepID=UPI0025DCB06C|nr:hypothetical protein [Nostoc sp. LPT]
MLHCLKNNAYGGLRLRTSNYYKNLVRSLVFFSQLWQVIITVHTNKFNNVSSVL